MGEEEMGNFLFYDPGGNLKERAVEIDEIY